jgi:PIN domain nuclease of toxin-antitoxin system
MILLDTCVLLWLSSEPDKLSDKAQAAIRGSGEYAYVSAITAWEIAWKNALGNLTLPTPPVEWFALAVKQHHLQELPITSAIAIRSAALPSLHRDPADRFLVATAQQHKLTLVTPDPTIHQYPDLKTAW